MSTSANKLARAPARGATLLCACLLASCAVGPAFNRPAPPKMNVYGAASSAPLASDGAVQTVRLGATVAPTWWRLFGSDSLNSLIEAGLRDSPNISAAKATLDESRAQARAGAGIFIPSAIGTFAATRERLAPPQAGENGSNSPLSLYTLAGAVSYSLDLFGGERRSFEALNAQADYQRHALGAAWLALTGNIVDAAIARAGYLEEKTALADIVRLDSDQRDVLTAEFKAGRAPWSVVLQAEQALGADRESLALTIQHLEAADNLLTLLVGREPAETRPPSPSLDELLAPSDVPVALPSQLVHQRPDILEAEAALHQATAQVGVATAALFPSISITGDYGATSTAFSKLAGPAGQFWSIGPSVDVPIFKGGALWYSRKAAQAAQRVATANYRQTVLSALEQVATQIKALDTDAEMSRAARATYDAAFENDSLASTNLAAGIIADYDAMTIKIVADRARLALIASRAQQLQDVVGLYLATGGGWSGQAAQAGTAPR